LSGGSAERSDQVTNVFASILWQEVMRPSNGRIPPDAAGRE
jgi:hypothetical protein